MSDPARVVHAGSLMQIAPTTFGLSPFVFALATFFSTASREYLACRTKEEAELSERADIRVTAFYTGQNAGFLVRVRPDDLDIGPADAEARAFLHLLVLANPRGDGVLLFEWIAPWTPAPPTEIPETVTAELHDEHLVNVADQLFGRIDRHLAHFVPDVDIVTIPADPPHCPDPVTLHRWDEGGAFVGVAGDELWQCAINADNSPDVENAGPAEDGAEVDWVAGAVAHLISINNLPPGTTGASDGATVRVKPPTS